jgi:two-component system, sensor histidine kinase and response regulator
MNPQDYTVLLADDNPENLNILSKIIEDAGYRVRTAKDGNLALKSMQAAPPDLALLDIHMPVMDGYALCKEIKNDSSLRHIPVLFISAIGESFNKVIAFDLGAVDYISKPADPREVLARVNTHLKIQELQNSLQDQNMQLEKEVEARTRELDEALGELKITHERLNMLDQAKNEFLKLISHELRTPMVGLGIIDELLNDKELSPEESACYQNIFWASHQKLINIVDHATTLTRLKLDNPTSLEGSCNLHQLIVKASESLKSLLETHQVSIDIQNDDGVLVLCDKEYFKMAINAVLETAIKFTKRPNDITVRWSQTESETTLIIESTGWTIPKKHMKNFFEIFSIEEAIFPGGDLGLSPAVAKQILNVCGGQITVENRGESGVTFNLSVPIHH